MLMMMIIFKTDRKEAGGKKRDVLQTRSKYKWLYEFYSLTALWGCVVC